MHGFKSFPKKTELPFTEGINVILGPNGSGKSNVSDALCFVLGRLSIKSMRATKASNLIFLGSKIAAPSKEAMVEMVFDNSDKTFTIDSKEVSIKRIVRKNGQSIYKINNETKTRQDVLSLMALAGIDPNGFNIILQGEIQNFVSMHTEERRKIIEEVSGIAIYESRKEKSIKELDKTEEKLKEVLAILKERTAYLNNLEKERQQALRYKKLEADVKKLKASIIYSDLTRAKKESDRVNFEIEKKQKEIEKVRKLMTTIRASIDSYEEKIDSINATIQKSTGLEQEKLNQEIANLRAQIAGTNVKIENYESKLSEIRRQKEELSENIKENELSVRELRKETGKSIVGSQQKDLNAKKLELEKLEEHRKKFYMIKSELKSLKARIEDKKSLLTSYSAESEYSLKHLQSLSKELFDRNTTKGKVEELKILSKEKQSIYEELLSKEKELEKISSAREFDIENQRNLMEKISKIDICPVCKSKMTESHISHINKETSQKIEELSKDIKNSDAQLSEIYSKKDMLKNQIDEINIEISKRDADLVKLDSIDEKKNQIKSLQDKINTLKSELNELVKIRTKLEKNQDDFMNVEEKYERVKIELQEIGLRSEENVGSEISFKERELERAKISLKQITREEEEIEEELNEVSDDLGNNEEILHKKREQEEALAKKFEKMISERDGFQDKIRETERELAQKQNSLHNIEQDMNDLKIEKAKSDAVVENLETEMLSFPDIEIIKANKESLIQKLSSTQEVLSRIGTVNLRSLEVYDSVKKEYDSIKERVDIISKEKESVLKIIHEIDIKKKKTFLRTLDSLNEIFSRNFSALSTKGTVYLDLENRKDPFDGGVNIIVKTGHGKYFDVKSLSGGEQTLVALSLIFAIQEHKPYPFYILDEIDAALDKRNSERLANLLKKYMQQGQYIVITHNDEIITNATNLYGVSMHDGISKVISLKI